MANSFTVVLNKGTSLIEDTILYSEIEYVTNLGNTFVIHNIKFGRAEWGGNLILHDLNLGAVTDDIFTIFNLTDTANIDTDGSIELQSVTTSGSFRVTEHHTNLHTNLVDENDSGLGLRYNGSELTHGLGHQTSLKTHLSITHIAINFSLRHKGSNRVDHDEIDGI